MTFSIFFIPLAVGVLFLLGFTLKKLISGFRIGRKINPAHSKLFVVALLGIWFFFSIYLLLDAVLGHSETAKSLFKWKCLLAFSLIVILPSAILFLLRDHFSERHRNMWRRKIRFTLIICITIPLIIFSAVKSGMWPPLAFAMRNNLTSLAQLLIKEKVTLNDRDAYRGTPFVYAAMKGDVKMMTLLLENGVQIYGEEKIGEHALEWACLRGNRPVEELLINRGIYVNTKFPNGATPLTMAAESGYLDFAEMLIERGADPGLRESHGKTAIMIAEERGNKKMTELLQSLKSGRPK